MRDKYDLDCDYYMLFIEHNYFIYRILDASRKKIGELHSGDYKKVG